MEARCLWDRVHDWRRRRRRPRRQQKDLVREWSPNSVERQEVRQYEGPWKEEAGGRA